MLFDRVRVFDPLKPVSGVKYDLVCHIPVCLDNIKRRQEGADRDFRCLQFQLENFKKIRPSDNPNFKMILIISVNGGIGQSSYITFLKSIPKQLTPQIETLIFQRPNVGWQWGALHDVWMRYKDSSYIFSTMECDVYFNDNKWYDRSYEILKNNPTAGFVGQPPGNHTLPNIGAYADFEIPKRVWRDGYNRVIEKPTQPISKHSRGGWYFCRRELLQSMDNTYGCFTFALGYENALDGIVLGEVGFSHKTEQLGFNWICQTLVNVFELGDI
jgi:hypothetical protein